ITIWPTVCGYCLRPTRDFRPPAPGQVTPTKSVLFRSEQATLQRVVRNCSIIDGRARRVARAYGRVPATKWDSTRPLNKRRPFIPQRRCPCSSNAVASES
ncbi:hypothetical protein T02_4202, partial [Trichinella nativa]